MCSATLDEQTRRRRGIGESLMVVVLSLFFRWWFPFQSFTKTTIVEKGLITCISSVFGFLAYIMCCWAIKYTVSSFLWGCDDDKWSCLMLGRACWSLHISWLGDPVRHFHCFANWDLQPWWLLCLLFAWFYLTDLSLKKKTCFRFCK